MGSDAQCTCVRNGEASYVKALLEAPELILRGEMRMRLPFSKMKRVRTGGNWLRFTFDGEVFALELGSAVATKWVKALLKTPPTLAQKLGIAAETTVRMIGPIDDDALKKALAEANEVSDRKCTLILARVDTPADLNTALKKSASQLKTGVPIWLIYRKGPGHPLNANQVRQTALSTGIVDTKVVAVSAEFSALKFVKRRG
jgi:hypothetical protein